MTEPTNFYQYAIAGSPSGPIIPAIIDCLTGLSTATTSEQVRQVCDTALAWLAENYKPASQASHNTAFRKAIAAYYSNFPVPDGLLVERRTSKGTVNQHLALNLMIVSPEAYAVARDATTAKTAIQRDNLIPINLDAALEALSVAVASTDWRELAAGLILASQSRPSDMLKSGGFELVSTYRVRFTTHAKQRNPDGKTEEIFTLIPASDFIDGFTRLRRTADVMALKNMTLAEIDSGKNSALNRAVIRVFGDVISAPYGETELSCKNLRAAGVVLAYHLFGRETQAIGRFAELQLIHDNSASAANYEDYYAVDASGAKLATVGTMLKFDLYKDAKPMSKTATSIRVDKLTMERVKSFKMDGSLNDQVNAIAAQAEQAQDLAKQLERAKAEIKKLKTQQTTAKATAVASEVATVPTEAVSVADLSSDIRKLENTALKGKRPGYAAERIRRAVAAIQDYNTGRDLADQIEINVGSLRTLAAASPVAVGEWVKAHAEEIAAYTAAQGHPGGANSKHNRGKNIAQLVPLAWNQ